MTPWPWLFTWSIWGQARPHATRRVALVMSERRLHNRLPETTYKAEDCQPPLLHALPQYPGLPTTPDHVHLGQHSRLTDARPMQLAAILLHSAELPLRANVQRQVGSNPTLRWIAWRSTMLRDLGRIWKAGALTAEDASSVDSMLYASGNLLCRSTTTTRLTNAAECEDRVSQESGASTAEDVYKYHFTNMKLTAVPVRIARTELPFSAQSCGGKEPLGVEVDLRAFAVHAT
ncbi:hypothetical protein C8R43DRAFT_1107905 [Mycena crocata]|nr:hypothetical protein C8R43DRAFT_1107905 [Mycena crocata]